MFRFDETLRFWRWRAAWGCTCCARRRQ